MNAAPGNRKRRSHDAQIGPMVDRTPPGVHPEPSLFCLSVKQRSTMMIGWRICCNPTGTNGYWLRRRFDNASVFPDDPLRHGRDDTIRMHRFAPCRDDAQVGSSLSIHPAWHHAGEIRTLGFAPAYPPESRSAQSEWSGHREDSPRSSVQRMHVLSENPSRLDSQIPFQTAWNHHWMPENAAEFPRPTQSLGRPTVCGTDAPPSGTRFIVS